MAQIARARAEGDELLLVGVDAARWRPSATTRSGEAGPTPGVLDFVARARAVGFRRVGLRTSARALAVDAAAAEPRGAAVEPRGAAVELRRAGATELLVPLYGPASDCHDYHVGGAGRFAATMAGIGAARLVGLEVLAVTAVTRSNFRVLEALVPVLLDHGVSGWSLALPSSISDADGRFARLVPRFALALPHVLYALDRALAAGLPTWLRGAPLCRVGRFARRVLPASGPTRGAPCLECAARERCSGVSGGYLRRYGDAELCALAPERLALALERDGADGLGAWVDSQPASVWRLLAADPCG